MIRVSLRKKPDLLSPTAYGVRVTEREPNERRSTSTGSSSGYSGTPLPEKLGIKPGHRILLDGAPDFFETDLLTPLPNGVTVHRRAARNVATQPYDLIVAFRGSKHDYVSRLRRDISRITKSGALWIAWPKKASGVATDLTENAVRENALGAGVVDVKVCAIDATWSGLKLVYRLKDR